MHNTTFAFVLSLILILYGVNAGAESITIDLAKNVGQTIKISKSSLTVDTVILKHRLLKHDTKYECDVESVPKVVPPFDASLIVASAQGERGTVGCEALVKYMAAVLSCDDEGKIQLTIDSVRLEIARLEKDPNLSPDCKKKIMQDSLALDSTTLVIVLPEHVDLQSDKDLSVTITRGTNIWKVIYSAPSESHWSILYGFTYVPNMMNPTTNYFAKQDTGGTYLITPLNGRRNDFLKNLSPTLMFTWHPTEKYRTGLEMLYSNDFYQLSFTAGIGLNLSTPTAMLGPSFLISDNVSLNGGVVFTQKDVLNGQYNEGQRIKENLTFDQLHEKQWMTEWFVSIGYRFDKNPFSSSSSKSSADSTKSK